MLHKRINAFYTRIVLWRKEVTVNRVILAPSKFLPFYIANSFSLSSISSYTVVLEQRQFEILTFAQFEIFPLTNEGKRVEKKPRRESFTEFSILYRIEEFVQTIKVGVTCTIKSFCVKTLKRISIVIMNQQLFLEKSTSYQSHEMFVLHIITCFSLSQNFMYFTQVNMQI